MKLLTAALLLTLTLPAHAAVIADLGVNPNSIQGIFNAAPGGGAFEDQFTFNLVGGPLFVSIASVTNVYPNPTDFITAFNAAVWTTGLDTLVNTADDALVIGPVAATACILVPNCQVASGSAILNPGAYYLEFTGTAGGTSGYGGNLSTFAVPGPALATGIPGLIALAGLLAWRRGKNRKSATA